MMTLNGESSQNCAVGDRNRLTAHTAVATTAPLMNTQKAVARTRYSESIARTLLLQRPTQAPLVGVLA